MSLDKSSIGVVWYDLFGNPYNGKYPPDYKKYGIRYEGYPTWNQEVLFYELAVIGYDASFVYHGKKYFLMADPEYYCTCPDDHYTPTAQSQFFPNGNALIEQLLIEGKTLLSIIDELDEVEMW